MSEQELKLTPLTVSCDGSDRKGDECSTVFTAEVMVPPSDPIEKRAEYIVSHVRDHEGWFVTGTHPLTALTLCPACVKRDGVPVTDIPIS